MKRVEREVARKSCNSSEVKRGNVEIFLEGISFSHGTAIRFNVRILARFRNNFPVPTTSIKQQFDLDSYLLLN